MSGQFVGAAESNTALRGATLRIEAVVFEEGIERLSQLTIKVDIRLPRGIVTTALGGPSDPKLTGGGRAARAGTRGCGHRCVVADPRFRRRVYSAHWRRGGEQRRHGFREPTSQNARRTLAVIVAVLGIFLAGIAHLTRAYGIMATVPGSKNYSKPAEYDYSSRSGQRHRVLHPHRIDPGVAVAVGQHRLC